MSALDHAVAHAGRYRAYVDAAYGLSALGLAALTGSSLYSAWRWRLAARRRRPGAPPRP